MRNVLFLILMLVATSAFAADTKFVPIVLDEQKTNALIQWANQELPGLWRDKLIEWLSTQELQAKHPPETPPQSPEEKPQK